MKTMEKIPIPTKSFTDFTHDRLNLMIDATNICPFHCTYCYFGDKGERMMDVEKVFAGIKNFYPLFPNIKWISFHYMGGEPLVAWKKILQLNAMAKDFFAARDIKFVWSLTSNLALLDDKKTEHMVHEKAGIHCSIDGPEDIQNKNRPYINGRGSYKDVIRHVPNALRITPEDTVRVTVCPEDATRLDEITEDMIKSGFKHIGLFPAYNMGWDDSSIEQWGLGIKKACDVAQAHGKKPDIIRTIIKFKPTKADKQYGYCGAGKGLWAFDVDGKLYFCHHFTNTCEMSLIDAPNATTEQIQSAILASQQPPQTNELPEKCQSCPARAFCGSSCWTSNFLNNGNATMPVEIECRLKKKTVEALEYILRTDRKLTDKEMKELTDCGKCYDCENCYGGCDKCDECDRCDVCVSCQKCDDCQRTCESNCQSRCEDSCQDRCEVGCDGCQRTCEVDCQVGCQIHWEGCVGGYP